ncbi:M23 family metallopeptidase [Litoreibacter janthinus]|uniref:Peptidase family M23 n=1 Tax=Litoreibacter janthinus TaxID=670154 RepID=A0A1I6HVG6_9RHOB|nr:M23 family metallopeptidase [Litoreibacter janthinus]SFR58435.1 Peptidase family M23 [Litoreibacter janthinus]
MRTPLLALSLIAFAAPVAAKDPLFSLPIDCDLGETCFIQNYVDVDPSEAHLDAFCGPLSYDGHKGTDIRLISLADMEAGVAVLAAAPGTVRAIRDGMADIASSAPNAPDLGGKDCGNGLVIDHGGGWETQYCHMKEGSVSVAKGQRVAKGTPLGEVGLSGRTEFPHIHMSIRQDGEVIDPFALDATPGKCNASKKTLWEDPIPYQPGGLLDAGFAGNVPDFAQIKAGMDDPAALSPEVAGLVLWGYAFGTQTGDVMEFNIKGPDGWRHDQLVEFRKNQAQLFRASGRKQPEGGWPNGAYIGTVTLSRGDIVLGQQTLSVTISQ